MVTDRRRFMQNSGRKKKEKKKPRWRDSGKKTLRQERDGKTVKN